MPSLSSGLLRAGLALKLSQIKLATRSYVRDRTDQATDTAASYAVAAGLFAAAGIFLIAACLVGVTALFRWIEIRYGLFPAFGAVGALLLLIAAVVAMLTRRLRLPYSVGLVAAGIFLAALPFAPKVPPRHQSGSVLVPQLEARRP